MDDIKKTFADGYKDSDVEAIREQRKQKRKEQDDKEQENQQEVDLTNASPYMLLKLGMEKLNKKNEDAE